jgi:long-subunit fatty acid transport protein
VDDGFICNSLVDRQPDGLRGPNLFLGDRLALSQVEQGDDVVFGSSLGLLWKIGDKARWRLGAVYRQGPRFSTETKLLDRSGTEILPRQPGSLTIPDTYGASIAYSTRAGKTKLAFDYNRIRYSQRNNELVRPLRRTLARQLEEVVTPEELRFELNDANQLHLGFEQVIPVIDPQLIGTLRLGVWREPFHDPAYVGSDEDLRNLLDAFLPEKTGARLHYTAGLGFVLREDFQVDIAADFSNRNDILSVSMVKFF